MSLIDKLKGILFDEEIEEIPEIKKDIRVETKRVEPVEEENPIREIKIPKEEIISKEYTKTEPSFTFPIDFDDDEIEDEPKTRFEEPKIRYEEPKKSIKKEKVQTRDYSSYLNRKDDKKQFKPTPIISPVYGILDQNYKKEDVIVKKEILRKPNELSLEEVRKRAFGSLEDDIEQNLVCDIIKDEDIEQPKIQEDIIKEEIIKDEIIVEEPVDKTKTIGELIEEDSLSIDIPKIESIKDDVDEYNNSDDFEEPKNSIDDLLEREEEMQDEIIIEQDEEEIDEEEADLFSLIDSMYEEKGE